jgi:hypothetical protein
VTRRITNTLDSLTIAQVAKLWAEETGEEVDLIERRLVQAAWENIRDLNSDEIGFCASLEQLSAYEGQSPAERAQSIRIAEKKLYSQVEGLFVDDRRGIITSSTIIRRTALEVWCKREGFQLQFLSIPEELDHNVRAWLIDQIKAVERERLAPRPKAAYRRDAIEEFGPGLTRRAFDRTWDSVAPDSWKRGGRRKKS